MSRLRQLPKLFLRGSLANETMRNLGKEQKAEVATIVEMVSNCEILLPHKIKFINVLSNTIGGDYRDDKGTRCGPYGPAEQEYNIIIWKATVFLLYHSSYQYKCTACCSDHYHNNRSKKVLFNRRFQVCPNCNSKATVITIPGTTKIANPYDIINDPIQRKKYYGEHIWGYFRQILKENDIRKHRTTEMVMLPADQLAVQELLNLLDNNKIFRLYYQNDSLTNGYYKIAVNTLSIPLDLSVDIGNIRSKYNKAGVDTIVDYKTILVRQCTNAPLMKSNLKNSTPITAVSNSSNSSSNDDLDLIDIIADDEAHPEKSYDSIDVLSKIKFMLPTECKPLFDILTNSGDDWRKFSKEFGDNTPKMAHISKYLDVSTKQIGTWKSQIKALMHSYGLVPETVS